MFVHYRTPAFFLKKTNRGESDQRFLCYTYRFGKVEVVGRAVRKIKSKLRQGAELFYCSEIEFIQGKSYKTLTDAIVIEKFLGIKKNLKRIALLHKISELVESFLREGERDVKLWRLFRETFLRLNGELPSRVNLLLVYYYFFWNFLSLSGYLPELYGCVVCQKSTGTGKIYFSAKEGGLLCATCFVKGIVHDAKEINRNVIKVLRIMVEEDWKTIAKLRIMPDYLKKLGIVSRDFLLSLPRYEK